MNRFSALFGINASQVRKSAILLPLLPKGALRAFGIKRLSRGKLYGSASRDDFTLIHTGLSAGLTGDAVLYLKETACQNIILFGSCGLTKTEKGLSIGSLVSPFRCFAYESFSDMLLVRESQVNAFSAHRELLGIFLKAGEKKGLREVTCASVSSLKLEEDCIDYFIKKGVDVLDMECSAFFAAAGANDFKAIALFYISDIVSEQPFYMNPMPKSKLSSCLRGAIVLLCDFLKKNLNA